MSTVPDPMSVRWPEMIDNQEKNTVFLKPLVTSPKIEVGEFTYYNDADDPAAFVTRNVLYTAGPEKLIIGKFCAIAAGAKFLLSSANHPVLGSTAFGGNPARPLEEAVRRPGHRPAAAPRLVELAPRRHHRARPHHLDRHARRTRAGSQGRRPAELTATSGGMSEKEEGAEIQWNMQLAAMTT
jgi:hypothetical protein